MLGWVMGGLVFAGMKSTVRVSPVLVGPTGTKPSPEAQRKPLIR